MNDLAKSDRLIAMILQMIRSDLPEYVLEIYISCGSSIFTFDGVSSSHSHIRQSLLGEFLAAMARGRLTRLHDSLESDHSRRFDDLLLFRLDYQDESCVAALGLRLRPGEFFFLGQAKWDHLDPLIALLRSALLTVPGGYQKLVNPPMPAVHGPSGAIDTLIITDAASAIVQFLRKTLV